MNNGGLNVFKQGARSAQPFEELNTGLTSMGEPSTVETQVVSGMKYKFSFDNGDQVHPMEICVFGLDVRPIVFAGVPFGMGSLGSCFCV